MSVIVNYLKSRIEILILNAKTGMDTTSQEYDKLCNDAVNAIKQVCLGVKGVFPQELTDLLQAITDAPLSWQLRGELRDLFNQKLSNDQCLSQTRSACAKDKCRLVEQIGDRVDKQYRFKLRDPKEVWKDLAKRLMELNP